MGLPFGNLDTTFDRCLQELPGDFRELAIEFKAFARSRKLKTPERLMRVGMNDCGIDAAWRETAGNCPRREERISDPATHHRGKAGVPWVKTLRSRMMGDAVKPPRAGPPRILLADGSTGQGPGATGTPDRLPRVIDLVRPPLVPVVVTGEPTGESVTHDPLQDGAVGMADRGDNRAGMGMEVADRGVGSIARDNPHRLPLQDAGGGKIAIGRRWQETTTTGVCWPVQAPHQNQAGLQGDPHARR